MVLAFCHCFLTRAKKIGEQRAVFKIRHSPGFSNLYICCLNFIQILPATHFRKAQMCLWAQG